MTIEPSSFRDPAGFVFTRRGAVFRQINENYREHYDRLMQSGLYADLIGAGLLVTHRECEADGAPSSSAYKVIAPDRIPFISYPSEWCFGQLKAAALATLAVQRRALDFGMTLKDASAFNIQFIGSRPVLIDTQSFECYTDGAPWIAYRQFCEHFLAPLALMSLTRADAAAVLGHSIEGIPLSLARRLLPWRSRLRPSLLMHLHFHALTIQKHQIASPSHKAGSVSLTGLHALIDNLGGAISRLASSAAGVGWDDYYDRTNYSEAAMQAKASLIENYLDQTKPNTVWDIGSNRGDFSRVAAKQPRYVVSADYDAAAVEINFERCRHDNQANILPLVIDFANPTPDFGWANTERTSFLKRGPADAVMALALIHHLAITKGVPFEKIAATFATACRILIVEFPDVVDSQVARMLTQNPLAANRYSNERFRHGFARHFDVLRSDHIPGSQRTLFLMQTKRT